MDRCWVQENFGYVVALFVTVGLHTNTDKTKSMISTPYFCLGCRQMYATKGGWKWMVPTTGGERKDERSALYTGWGWWGVHGRKSAAGPQGGAFDAVYVSL